MRARHFAVTAVVSALLMGTATAANATLISFNANLNQATEVNHLSPPSPATGNAQLIFDTTAHTLTMNWTFQDIVGTTTDAHIHCCTTNPGIISGAVVATHPLDSIIAPGFLGTHAGTITVTFDTSQSSAWNPGFLNNATNLGNPLTAEATLLAGASAGRAYFNIHSTLVPSGEIAGFLVPVPEPSTLPLFAFAVVGLMFARRKPKAA